MSTQRITSPAHRIDSRRILSHRALSVGAGLLLAAGATLGLTACNGGAQTGPNSTETPSPSPSSTVFETPVPTTVDDSGTLGG